MGLDLILDPPAEAGGNSAKWDVLVINRNVGLAHSRMKSAQEKPALAEVCCELL